MKTKKDPRERVKSAMLALCRELDRAVEDGLTLQEGVEVMDLLLMDRGLGSVSPFLNQIKQMQQGGTLVQVSHKEVKRMVDAACKDVLKTEG